MLFIPENELEKALVRAVKEPQTAPLFYRLLLSSDVLVLGTVEGQEGATAAFSLAPGGRIKLVTGTKNGSQYLPLFSSLARMQDYVKQESKYLSVNGRALLDLTRGAPVILNPASEYGKELSPEDVRQLLEGSAEIRAIAGEAAGVPLALLEMLAGLVATRSEVQAAWMIQVANAERPQQPHPLIGIETTSPSAWPLLMQAIESAAQMQLPGVMFDIQRVDRLNPSGMTGALLQAEPFYRRPAINPTVN
jgi:hypothetical protein